MLERVDRIQPAVADAAETARAFQEILGAEPAREEAATISTRDGPGWPWAASCARISRTDAAEKYTRLFGLDPGHFSPITSERFGYTGTLTLFDPPGRLDRIEISQVTRPDTAMGRWASRRGDSLYMCYAETDERVVP